MKKQFKRSKRFVALGMLNIDAAYQDRPSKAHIREMVDNFDLDALGLIHVSERTDKSLWLVDGQHRLAVLREFLGDGWESQHTEAIVYSDLSREDEAWLYVHLNNIKPKRPFARFHARLAYGEHIAVSVQKIANEIGFAISDGTGALSCVGALEGIFIGMRARNSQEGPLNLKRTLGAVAKAWGIKAPHPNGNIIEGLGLFFERFGNEIDHERLVHKLAGMAGGFQGLLGKARQFRDIEGGTVARAVFELVLRDYNTGIRGKKLKSLRKDEDGE